MHETEQERGRALSCMLQCVGAPSLAVTVCCSVLQHVAVCCSVLQCAALSSHCNTQETLLQLQCVAVYRDLDMHETEQERERTCAHARTRARERDTDTERDTNT